VPSLKELNTKKLEENEDISGNKKQSPNNEQYYKIEN